MDQPGPGVQIPCQGRAQESRHGISMHLPPPSMNPDCCATRHSGEGGEGEGEEEGEGEGEGKEKEKEKEKETGKKEKEKAKRK